MVEDPLRRGRPHAGLRSHRHRLRPGRAARGRAGGEAEEVRARRREGPARRRRVRPHRHDPVEDAARDGAQSFRLARARLLRPRPPRQAGHHRRGSAPAALASRSTTRSRCSSTSSRATTSTWITGDGALPRSAHDRGRRPRPATAALHAPSASSSPSAPSPIARPHIPFDGEAILDADEILDLKRLPRSLAVIGGERHRHRVRDHLLARST